jgi:hypothetical protein
MTVWSFVDFGLIRLNDRCPQSFLSLMPIFLNMCIEYWLVARNNIPISEKIVKSDNI